MATFCGLRPDHAIGDFRLEVEASIAAGIHRLQAVGNAQFVIRRFLHQRAID